MMELLNLLTILSFIILIYSCSERTNSPIGIGIISGEVYDKSTNKIITDVKIYTEPATSVVYNGLDGTFTIKDVEAGSYSVLADKAGYKKGSLQVEVSGNKTSYAIFFLEGTSSFNHDPDKPNLLTPSSNFVIDSNYATLKWSCSDIDEDTLKYDVYLSENSKNMKLVASKIKLNEIKTEYLDSYTTYFWKVVAYDRFTNTESDIQSFIVKRKYSIPNSELLLYYSFNHSNANDQSGNSKNGNLFNQVTFTDGVEGLAARISGTSQVNVDGSFIGLPILNFKNYTQFSISMWIQEEVNHNIIGEAYINWGNQSDGWLGIATYSKPEVPSILIYNFSVGCESSDFYKRQKPIWIDYDISQAQEWNHFALVYNSGTVFAYINGKFVGSSSLSIVNLDEAYAAIGKHSWTNEGVTSTTSLTFLIDELRIYKVALSESQVKELAE